MFAIFGIFLLMTACHSHGSLISSQSESNEIGDENYSLADDELLREVDPSIIEDAKSKTVIYRNSIFNFSNFKASIY